MIGQMILAAMLVVAGGILHGSFAFPIRRLEKKWKWENVWLVYSTVGLILLPFYLGYRTIPSPAEVYSVAPASTIAAVVLFGLGCGLGLMLYAFGVSRIGMATASAVVLGLTTVFGSLLPFLIQTPADIITRRGVMLLISLLLVVAAVALLAGGRSQRDHDRRGPVAGLEPVDFTNGMIFSVASGVLLPMLNFSVAFGKPLQDAAIVFGALPNLAANAIWVPALAGAFLPNALCALFLLYRKKTWGRYAAGGKGWFYLLGASAMGLLWYGGTALYGMGVVMMGAIGPVIGWPMLISTSIVTMSLVGVLTGEWSGAGSKARTLSIAGAGLLVVAIVVVALAGQA